MPAIDVLWIILACFGAYLIGSLPFSVWIGRLIKGEDLCDRHTGNPGGFNAIRTYGLAIGLPILFLDVIKGFIVTLLVDQIFSKPYFMDNSPLYHRIMCIIGPALAILGHNFSIWLKFSGGQGLGVFNGILLYSNPLIFVYYAVLIISLGALTKISQRNVGLISVFVTIPFAFFLPIGPPWAYIITDWVVGPNGLIYLTQGLMVTIAGLALLAAVFKQILSQSRIGIEKMTEVG